MEARFAGGAAARPRSRRGSRGLALVFQGPYLPASSAVALGFRRLRLGIQSSSASAGAWERLAELAESEPRGTFEILSLLIGDEMRSSYGYLPEEFVRPTFRHILRSDDPDLRSRAEHLIHRLGERGQLDLSDL